MPDKPHDPGPLTEGSKRRVAALAVTLAILYTSLTFVVPAAQAQPLPETSVAPSCQASALAVTAGPAQAGTTHVGLPIVFRNIGAHACRMRGYPTVVGLNAAGHVVAHASQTPAGYLGGLRNASAPPLVVVQPGKRAAAFVEGYDFNIKDPRDMTCPQYVDLLVTPPGTSRPVRVPVAPSVGLCSGLEVHPVVPGPSGDLSLSRSSAKAPDHDFALALLQWERGAQAGPADYHHYWAAAATDLTKAVTAWLPGTSGYSRAAGELLKLVHLPFVVNTPVQAQTGAVADFEALNSFFSTDGLYDVNAPSASPAAFVATLRLEARSGTIQVVADPVIGTAPRSYPGAIVACPVLSPLAFKAVALSPLSYDDTFGCKLTTSGTGTYYMVGVISAAHATEYEATITGLDNGTPVFTCAEFDDAAQLQVAKKLGARCK